MSSIPFDLINTLIFYWTHSSSAHRRKESRKIKSYRGDPLLYISPRYTSRCWTVDSYFVFFFNSFICCVTAKSVRNAIGYDQSNIEQIHGMCLPWAKGSYEHCHQEGSQADEKRSKTAAFSKFTLESTKCSILKCNLQLKSYVIYVVLICFKLNMSWVLRCLVYTELWLLFSGLVICIEME